MNARKFTVIVSTALLLAACAGGLHENVHLQWRPTTDPYDVQPSALTDLYDRRIMVEPFVDARPDRREIARNVEGKRELPVTTRDNVGKWCAEQLREIGRQFGLSIVDTDPAVVVRGEVLRFFVVEDSLYRGSVGIRVTVANTRGERIWQGMMTGTAKRFGSSYSEENYFETLSDAYLEAIHGLLENEGFRKAIQKAG